MGFYGNIWQSTDQPKIPKRLPDFAFPLLMWTPEILKKSGTLFSSNKERTSAPFPKRSINREKPFSGDYFRAFFQLL
jgi:hypothetical protein